MAFNILSILLVCIIGSALCGEFLNCNENAPMKLFFKYPDPLFIHSGQAVHYESHSSIKEDMPANMITEYKVQKQIFGIWITVFSASDVATCKTFKRWGFSGPCPLKKGEFRNTKLKFDLPKFRFANFFVNGNYRIHVEGYNEDRSKLLYCGDIRQGIQQVQSTPIVVTEYTLPQNEL